MPGGKKKPEVLKSNEIVRPLGARHRPEIIRSNELIHKGDVDRVEIETFKTKASIVIACLSLAIASIVLAVAAYNGNSELQTWATGLISAIAGAAISYGFNGRRG
jgi:hypothetical protein